MAICIPRREIWTLVPPVLARLAPAFRDAIVLVTPAFKGNVVKPVAATAAPALIGAGNTLAYDTLASGITIPSVSFSTASMTALFVVRNMQLSGTNHGFWREGSGSTGDTFFIIRGYDKRPWIRWSGGDILSPGASGDVFAAGGNYNIVYRVTSGVGSDVWWNGQQRYTGSTPSSKSGSIANLGWQSNSGEKVGGIVAAIFWPRSVIDPEVAAMTGNPGYVFEP